jgi:hypothetical protein
MKLLDILLEILRESKPITLDKSVVPQMEKIYEKFKKLENDENTKRYFEYGGKGVTLGRIRFKNQYDPKFDGVDVYLFFDENEDVLAEYSSKTKIVYINFNSDIGKDKTVFMNALYHELVHAIDPKLNKDQVKSNLFTKLISKNDKDKTSSDYTKYLKNPAEFDAWSSTFVNQIKDGLEILPDADKQRVKAALKVLINALLGLLKNNPNANLDFTQEMFDDFKSKYWKQLGIVQRLTFSDSKNTIHDFLANIVEYLNKPSQFKKYIQRLSTVL